MASSTISSMILFLLLVVLVFPHVDKALGEQMQLRKLEETDHHDQLTTLHGRVLLPSWVGKSLFNNIFKRKIPDKAHPRWEATNEATDKQKSNNCFLKWCKKAAEEATNIPDFVHRPLPPVPGPLPPVPGPLPPP